MHTSIWEFGNRRIIAEHWSQLMQVFFFGRAPHAHIQQESSLLFLHRAQLIQGRPAFVPGSHISDHLWLAKDEVSEVIPDSELLQTLTKLL